MEGESAQRDGRVVIKHFRLVFDRGRRRLFRLDHWRLPFPYGVEVLGIAYGLAVLLAVVAAHLLPVIGSLLREVPGPIRFVGIPVGSAMLLLRWRPDGLSPHQAWWEWLQATTTVSRLSCWQPVEKSGDRLILGEITCAPDGRSRRYRPGRIVGPARVLLRYPARAWQEGRTLHVQQTAERPMWVGKQVTLERGQRVVFEREGT
jgi:hypothetical protein